MTGGVAISGIGAVTPRGTGPAIWEAYRRGLDGDGRLAEVPLSGLPEGVRARAARAERMTQLLLVAGGTALEAARLQCTEGPPRPGVGAVVGTAFGCFLTNAAYQQRFADAGAPGASPRLFAATVSNAAVGELAIAYRLGGPSVTLSAGGASGLVALGHAVDLLHAGRADALVAGGVDALGAPLERWLTASDHAVGSCPPTEAAAVVVLESTSAARQRGARVLGTIEGYGAGFEPGPAGSGMGEGLAAAIAQALGEAGCVPSDLALYVSASPGAFSSEVEALAEERWLRGASYPPISMPKDALGETFGAAGALGLLAAFAEAPAGATVLVVDVCPSGHVAALVARRTADA